MMDDDAHVAEIRRHLRALEEAETPAEKIDALEFIIREAATLQEKYMLQH